VTCRFCLSRRAAASSGRTENHYSDSVCKRFCIWMLRDADHPGITEAMEEHAALVSRDARWADSRSADGLRDSDLIEDGLEASRVVHLSGRDLDG